MAAPAFAQQNRQSARVADPALREALLKFARRRLPAGEVDDLVQNTLADALGAANAPSEETAFRRWVQGIARNKIADLYRRRGRLPPIDGDLDESASEPAAETGELVQWIERELPKTDGAEATLHWLLRESEGETLDEIAREAALPAPRVRQRVSRLRRHFQTRWLALGAAGLGLLIAAGFLYREWAQPETAPIAITPEQATPEDRARALRDGALEHCAQAQYQECLLELDQAKALDPIGEQASAVQAARAAAARALTPTPDPSAHTLAPTPEQKSAPMKARPKEPSPKLKPQPKAQPQQQFSKKAAAPNQEIEPLFQQQPQQDVGRKLVPTKD
jgi:RNA polymerase sigma factor (sigma-70 family)